MINSRRVGDLSPAHTYGVGAASGVVAGVAMGLVLQFGMDAMSLVGALYGMPTVLAGWIAHLVHSVAFALAFVTVVERTPVRVMVQSIPDSVGLGLVYGAFLSIAMGGLALPLMVNAVGAANLPVPLLPIPGSSGVVEFGLFLGLAHLVYGGLLGTVYGVARIDVILDERDEGVEAPAKP